MPPVSLVIKTIKYVINCNAKGTLIVPKWVSAPYWPYVFKDNLKTFVYVSDVLEFEDSTKIFIQGMNKNSIFGSERFYSSVLAIRLDATKMWLIWLFYISEVCTAVKGPGTLDMLLIRSWYGGTADDRIF